MDALHDLLMGFSVALAPGNLLYAFLGSAFGTLIACSRYQAGGGHRTADSAHRAA
jgi:hypothetical protein